MTRQIREVAAYALPLILLGCAGVSSEGIDNEKAMAAIRTAALRPAIVSCLQARLDDLGDSVHTTPDVSPGVTRIDIGKPKSGAFQYFYRLDILEMTSGANVTVRKAPAPFVGMTKARLDEVLNRCAPPL